MTVSRQPPHDLSAERSVLGGLLLESEAFDEVEDVPVVAGDFYIDAHSKIFECMLELRSANSPVDAVTLRERLVTKNYLKAVGGDDYLLELTSTIPIISNILSHAKIVREKSIVRSVISACHKTASLGYGDYGSLDDFLGHTESLLGESLEANQGNHGDVYTCSEVIAEAFQGIVAHADRGGGLAGHMSGFPDIDETLSGFEPGKIYVIAGRPGSGKSTIAKDLTLGIVKKSRLPGFVVSLEMSRRQWGHRMMASEANVLFNKVKTAKFTNEEWSRLSESANDISKLPLYFADRPGEHVESVVRNAKRLRRKNGGKLGVVLVDYLQLLGSSRKFQVREQEVSYFSRSLMALAHECDVPVLCLSQLNRAVESRADKRPMISDMRECLPIDEWVYTAGGPVQLGSRPSSVISSTASGVTENPCSYVPKRHNSVIEVVTQFGRFRVTPRHLVLTGTGYKQARHLQPGRDVVAAPNRIPHANRGALPHARLLGWLLGNGGLSGTPSLIYRDELDADVRAAVAAFGVDVKARKNQKCECVVDAYLSNGVESGCSPNPLMGWIRELGLEGKTAHDKSVPTTYLGSSDETHIDLLRGLWESDGTVTNGDAKYSTVNELLARQVAWLLLTVGVRSTVSLHDGLWTVRASTVDSARMSPIVNAPGRFGVLAEPDPARIDPAPQIFVDLAAELSTARRFQRRTDGTHKLICKRDMEAIVKWTPGLDTIARSPYMTTPGVGWGCVLEVRKQDKPVRVADLQVPGPNNFVASGMVVHNSGAIEQDADAIMLVYRDEYYYGQESKNKGIVEINVAKQRDGETGVRNLAWQGSYIRIANLDNHHDPEDVNDQHWSDR